MILLSLNMAVLLMCIVFKMWFEKRDASETSTLYCEVLWETKWLWNNYKANFWSYVLAFECFRTERLARNICRDVGRGPLIGLCVLKGGYQFFGDLMDYIRTINANGGQWTKFWSGEQLAWTKHSKNLQISSNTRIVSVFNAIILICIS